MTRRRAPRIAFAGDRDVAVWVLDFLLEQDVRPLALMVPARARASHAGELRERCAFLDDDLVFEGDAFRSPDGIESLAALGLDLVIAIHFPYIFPPAVLDVPREGALNLHPSLLPYTRGWHTPSWTILENTPAGATLHFMDAGVDTGDIICQRALDVDAGDTADTLYQRLKQLELDVFREAWPAVAAGTYHRRPQRGRGTAHDRRELFSADVQRIDLDAPTTARDVLRQLRALSTSRLDEAAWFEHDGGRYRVQVSITRDDDGAAAAQNLAGSAAAGRNGRAGHSADHPRSSAKPIHSNSAT